MPVTVNKDKNHVVKEQEEDGHEAATRALRLEQQAECRRLLERFAEEGSENGNDGSSGEGQVSMLIETTRKRLGDLSLTLEEIGGRSTVEPYTPFRGAEARRDEETETENREVEDTGATEGVERTQGYGSRSNLFGSGSSHPGSQSNLVGPNVPNFGGVPYGGPSLEGRVLEGRLGRS